MLGAVLWVLLGLVLLLGSWALLRANRLDRLHVRTDAAAAGLVAALERRAVVARSIAALLPGAQAAALRAAADAAERASTDREAAENELTRALATLRGVPEGLLAELIEAEQRVVIGRQVHNDAVRDTLALRGTRLVRWLRLAGTAAAPRYFEIADTVSGAERPGLADRV